MLEVPISDIIEQMKIFSSKDMGKTWHMGTGGGRGYYHEAPTYGETLPGKLKSIKKKVSIYLDCVGSGDAATPCRFQHE